MEEMMMMRSLTRLGCQIEQRRKVRLKHNPKEEAIMEE